MRLARSPIRKNLEYLLIEYFLTFFKTTYLYHSDEEEDEEEEEQEAVDSPIDPDSVFRFRRAQASAIASADAEEVGEEEESRPKGLLAGIERSNPNLTKKHDKMIKLKGMGLDEEDSENPEAGLSRREREELEAIRKKEEYMRRHLAGETEQARKDIERLALVKQRREEAKLKRELEGRKPGMSAYGLADEDGSGSSDDEEVKESSKATSSKVVVDPTIAAKKKAAAAGTESSTSSSGAPEKLKSIDIKKMNADTLKEHLKARSLDTQGQKKDLLKRLLDYESARA